MYNYLFGFIVVLILMLFKYDSESVVTYCSFETSSFGVLCGMFWEDVTAA